MDRNGKESSTVNNCSENKPLVSVGSEKVELNGELTEYNETQSLLPPGQSPRGGLSKKSGNPRRKVQWNDKDGNKLAEVVIFQPSDVSDSEDEDEDEDSCMCVIM